MRNLFAELQAQLHKQNITEVILPIIEITHSSFDSPVRLVRNTENITSDGEEFVAYAFDIKLPDDKSDQPTEATIAIDNVNKLIGRTIQGLAENPNDKALVSCWLIIASDPDVRQLMFSELTVQDFEIDEFTVAVSLSNDPLSDELVPADQFNLANAPGLFR